MEDRKLNSIIESKSVNNIKVKARCEGEANIHGAEIARMDMTDILLEVKNLTVVFNKDKRRGTALDNIGLTIPRGRIIGLVGESGCGKTMLGSSIIGLLPERGAEITDGEINFYDAGSDGIQCVNLLNLNYHGMKKYRGSKISMIFQEPMSSLNPVYTVGSQIYETIANKNPNMSYNEVKERSIEMLLKVGMPDPALVYKAYPHQLSGGMRQRVVIAIALANDPGLIIADEPTTALDITVSEQILFLLYNIRERFNSSIVLITHDLSVVANICDEVCVMYRGVIVESGSTREIFNAPRNPYTIGLMESLPEFGVHKKPLRVISGSVPSIFEDVQGCGFRGRCYKAAAECKSIPPLKHAGGAHYYRCHF